MLNCLCVLQGGEEPDAGAAAAAGRGVPGLAARRPGEGPQEARGAGAEEAGGGGRPPVRAGRGEQETGKDGWTDGRPAGHP